MDTSSDPKGILLLTGTVGTGKTTIAIEIGEQLAEMNLPNAVIDLDWLGWANVGDDFHGYDQLIMQNLVSTWENYRAIGVEYLVMARALLQREPVDDLINIFPNTRIMIVRLTASKDTIEKRLSTRDSGKTLREHLAEMEVMERIMEELKLEHATMETDDITVEEIARRVVTITGWNQ